MTSKITKDDIATAIASSRSMSEAATKLACNPKTFRTHAIKHGLYKTNQAGKGVFKKRPRILLTDILTNKHVGYHSYKLKYRLVEELKWAWQCQSCGLKKWMGTTCPLELDHIDGDHNNNNIFNLRLLCPNCHAQTSTYRNKKRSLPLEQ